MKSKIKNLLGEKPRPQSKSHESVSIKRIRTWHSQNDQLQDSEWNQPLTTKLSSHPDLITVMHENQQLKLEILRLKYQLSKYESGKHKSQTSLKTISEENPQETERLKGILQKSYYSIQQMDKKIKKLQNQLNLQIKSHSITQKKMKLVIVQKEEAERRMKSIVCVHREEMRICSQKIEKLEGYVDSLIDQMGKDQKEWKKHMEQLKAFNEFFLKRTHQ